MVLLVVTPHEWVAAWASEPIEMGPGSSFRPTVLGPAAVPWVRNAEEARAAPELAVLSALAHANAPGGVATVLSAIAGLYAIDDEHRAVYYDLIWASLGAAVKKELEALALTENYEYQSDFARKYYAQGEAEGRAVGEAEGRAVGEAEGRAVGEAEGRAVGEAEGRAVGEAEGRAVGEAEGRAVGEAVGRAEMLRALLKHRGLGVSKEIDARLLGATAAQIEAWFVRALDATDAAQVFEEDR